MGDLSNKATAVEVSSNSKILNQNSDIPDTRHARAFEVLRNAVKLADRFDLGNMLNSDFQRALAQADSILKGEV